MLTHCVLVDYLWWRLLSYTSENCIVLTKLLWLVSKKVLLVSDRILVYDLRLVIFCLVEDQLAK